MGMEKIKEVLGVYAFASADECCERLGEVLAEVEAFRAGRERGESELAGLREETADLFCAVLRGRGVEAADVLEAARRCWVADARGACELLLGGGDFVSAFNAAGCNQHGHGWAGDCTGGGGGSGGGDDGMAKVKKAKRVNDVGAVVKVKKEWLDPGEDGSTQYVVLEKQGDDKVLVQALGTGLPLAPTYVYKTEWLDMAK